MIVLPGDAVPLAANSDTKLGPGTYLEGGKEGGLCIFDKPGILRRREKDGSQHFWVHTQQKRVRQTSRTCKKYLCTYQYITPITQYGMDVATPGGFDFLILQTVPHFVVF